MQALFAAGQADAAHALLTVTGLSSWLHMMDDLHATITMEAWDPSIKPNTTFSHARGHLPTIRGIEIDTVAFGVNPGSVRVVSPGQPSPRSRPMGRLSPWPARGTASPPSPADRRA